MRTDRYGVATPSDESPHETFGSVTDRHRCMPAEPQKKGRLRIDPANSVLLNLGPVGHQAFRRVSSDDGGKQLPGDGP